MVALAYLVCVLTPGASSALGTAHVANCVVDGIVAQVAAHDHAAMNHDHTGMTDQAPDRAAPTGGHHKMAGGACCAVMCVSALPASLIDLGKPAPPVAAVVTEPSRTATSTPPPRLYRPPIS